MQLFSGPSQENDQTLKGFYVLLHTHVHKVIRSPQNSVGKTEPQPPSRAVPEEPLPGCDAHQMIHLEKLSQTKRDSQEYGTHYRMQRKTIWGLHNNDYRMFRELSKGTRRETSRLFGRKKQKIEGQGGKMGQSCK